MPYPCPYCTEFLGRSFEKLLNHIRFIHSHEPNFSIACANCGQTFRNFSSFKSHVQREKKRLAENHQEAIHVDEQNEADDNEQDHELFGDEEIDEDGDSLDNITRFLALFILKTKEEHQLDQQTIDAIINNTEDLVESSLEDFKAKVKSCLSNNGLEVENIEGLEDILEQRSIFAQVKERLSNGYLQAKYFLQNFDLVEPEEVVLANHVEYQVVNGRHKLKRVKDVFHYIPILRTLKALLNQPDILEQVHNSHASDDGILRDFCDGEDFKEHELFGEDPLALILQCYFDEFQVTNPLGSKTKKHKIGAFYFVLGNINPKYRSVLNVIQLVALCKVPLISKYGMDRILAPFVKDLNCLEEENGVRFIIEGSERMFRGSIGPFNADNLGAHSVGGFIESFSSVRICRVCMATSDDAQNKFTEDEFNLRTKESHERHCNLVQNDPAMASTYGVKRNSILNQSHYFHVIGGLDLDVMHDQLEGVLPLEMKMMLKKFIQDGLLTVDEINERIEKFSYGPADIKNKPSPLKPQQLGNVSASLSQSAAQMWCLARMFPLIAGDLVPLNDKYWENFLKLLKIEEIVFAPKTTVQIAAYLGLLIEEYLEEFGELYERNRIPKQHFMVHYPRQIVRRGPLVRNWTMRFEAKHNFFKRLVDKINNFKNITYSLAKRHQALQAYLQQTSSGHFLRLSMEVGPGKKSTVGRENLEETLHDLNDLIGRDSELTNASWVKVYGTVYSKGTIIITGMHHGSPAFGKIHKILVVDGTLVVFEYKKLLTREYVEHLNAYRVTVSANETDFVEQKNLLDFHPLGMHKGFGCYGAQWFVVLRYRVDLML